MKLDLRFSVNGRARFLSHLECVDMLLAAFRRAGFTVALSQGMRPKPVISLAVARAVGVAACDEHATVELVGDHEPEQVRGRLAATLPRGIGVHEVHPSAGTARPVAARYRIDCDAPGDVVELAAARFAASADAVVERRSPKGVKAVDVRAFVDGVDPVDGGFEVEVAVTANGSARPEEVARALEQCAGTPIRATGLTRLTVRVADPRRETVGTTSHPFHAAGAPPGETT